MWRLNLYKRASLRLIPPLSVLLALLTPSLLSSQEVTHLRPPSGGSVCSVAAERVATLGEVEGPGIVASTGVVSADSHGRFYTAHMAAPGQIVMFDSSGDHLQSIGRVGEGPGEYRAISGIHISTGDTIHVFDNGNTRRTVLSPYPDLEVVRTARMALPFQAWRGVVGDSGSYVSAFPFGAANHIGYPLHEATSDGEIRSFGSENPEFEPGSSLKLQRVATRAAGDMIWAGHRTRYQIDLWTRDNRRLQTLQRDTPWFTPYDQVAIVTPTEPPSPSMVGIREDETRRLWVLVLVPAENWADGLREVTALNGERAYELASTSVTFDTVLDVLDPTQGTVIASRRFDEEVLTFLPDGRLVAHREDSNGVPYLDILEASIRCP